MRSRCDLSKVKYYKDEGIRVGFTCGPDWEKHDCGVIALSIITNISYKLAHDLLAAWGRKDKEGICIGDWQHFLHEAPFRWRCLPIVPVTIRKFIKRRPKGRYAVLFRPNSHTCHLAAVVDRSFYNCGVDSMRCFVAAAWRYEGYR